jgi:hypothetical protein
MLVTRPNNVIATANSTIDVDAKDIRMSTAIADIASASVSSE